MRPAAQHQHRGRSPGGMPSNESNARSIALAKGYHVECRGCELVAFDSATGEAVATAANWSAMLGAIIRAPRRGDGGDAA